MLYQALIAGTALLVGSGRAVAAGGSHASCKIGSIAAASSESVHVIEAAAVKVGAALCYDGPAKYEEYAASAHSTATAFAEVLVAVSVDCYATGNAAFLVDGHSVAYAQAIAIAEAYATAATHATTCGKCEAAGIAVAESFKKIFLAATAEIEFEFIGIADGGDVSKSTTIIAAAIEEATVEAFALAIATAYADHEECSGTGVAITAAGEEDGPKSFTICGVDLKTATDAYVSDALVDVYASAGAQACLDVAGGSTSSFLVEGTAIAEAMAKAMAQVSGGCYVKGKGYGCAAGEAEITKTAKAVAAAFAGGFASATNDCFNPCHADVSALTIAISKILATATAEAMGGQCTGPDPFFLYQETEIAIVRTAAEAIAQVIVSATVDASGCSATVEVGAGVTDPETTIISGDGPVPTKRGHKGGKKGGRKVAKKGGKKGKKGGKKGRKSHKKGRKGRKGGKKGGRKGKKGGHKKGRKGGKRHAKRHGGRKHGHRHSRRY